MKEYKAAVRTLELILKYHPCGLGVILGSYPPPDAEEWDEMLSMARPSTDKIHVNGGTVTDHILACVASADEMDQIINAMGGWHGVAEAAKSVKMEQPELWTHFVLHLDRVEGAKAARTQIDGMSPRDALAAELKITSRTLTEHRYLVPRIIARKALNSFQYALISR